MNAQFNVNDVGKKSSRREGRRLENLMLCQKVLEFSCNSSFPLYRKTLQEEKLSVFMLWEIRIESPSVVYTGP